MIYDFIVAETNDLFKTLGTLYPIISQSKEGLLIIKSMIVSIPETELLKYEHVSKYIDIIDFQNKDYSNVIFLDNTYGYPESHRYDKHFFFDNHFSGNALASIQKHNLGFNKYGMNVYPSIYLDYNNVDDQGYFGSAVDKTLFDIKFYGYNSLNYKVDYISNKYFKHWDYNSDSFYSTSLHNNPRNFESILDLNGLYLVGYEHFYNLDTFLKYLFGYYTQIALPESNAFDVGIQQGVNIFQYDTPNQPRYGGLRCNLKDEHMNQVDDINKIDFSLIYGSHYPKNNLTGLSVYYDSNEYKNGIQTLIESNKMYSSSILDDIYIQFKYELDKIAQLKLNNYSELEKFEYIRQFYAKLNASGICYDKVTHKIAQREIDLI